MKIKRLPQNQRNRVPLRMKRFSTGFHAHEILLRIRESIAPAYITIPLFLRLFHSDGILG